MTILSVHQCADDGEGIKFPPGQHRRPPHARIAASKHAGKVSLSLRGASALSGNNWAELLYLRPLFIRMRRSSSPALRVVTLLPATRTYSQRGWGCNPARLAEFRARLAAGLRQEQVDALLSDPVDHLPCRDTDLPERHNQKSLCAVGRSGANGTEFHGVYSDALEHLARVVRGDAGAVETSTDGGTGE